MRDLATLPKAHLHLHLEGAMRASTVADLAVAQGVPAPELRGYRSFTEFCDRYLAAADLVRTWSDLRRVVCEVVEDAAAAGAVWVEPQTFPFRYTELFGTSVDVVLEAVLDEGRRAADRLGIGFGLMVTAIRTNDPAESVVLAKAATRLADQGVVSFGLASDEALAPPEPFAEAFALARAAGLISAPHAGELAGPASVRGALDALGARRVAHGVRAIEDPRLVERLVRDEVTLDVCPTSNLRLGVVPSLDQHPLPALLEAGVRCTLNGDDPLFFDASILDEYELARHTFGLSDAQLALLARHSLEASGAPAALIARECAQIDTWLR